MLTRPARRERSRRTVPRRTCRWRNERVCSRSSHTSIASTFVQAQQKTRIGAWVIARQSLPSNLDNSSRPQKSSRSIPAVIPLNRSASSASSSAIAIGSGNKLDWIVSIKVLKRLPHTSSRLCSHPAADAKARAVGGQAEAEHQQAASRAQGLSYLLRGKARRSTGRTKCGQLTSLISPCDRVFVPGRDHRLGYPTSAILAAVEHAHGGILR
jgi:hypothetical protein